MEVVSYVLNEGKITKKTPKNNGRNIDKKLTFCSPLYAYFFCNTKKIKPLKKKKKSPISG